MEMNSPAIDFGAPYKQNKFMKLYLFLWSAITAYLGFEYWALTYRPALSLLHRAETSGLIHAAIGPGPGGPLSVWLGWGGFGLMLLMNVYSMRKRFGFLASAGPLRSWLNFHVFCGLTGPTLIFFHCQLKVRGIVGISFWSMIVSLSSGIVGRYFYVQLTGKKSDLEDLAIRWQGALERLLENRKIAADASVKSQVLARAIAHVGGFSEARAVNPFTAMTMSLMGDVRLMFASPAVPSNWPRESSHVVAEYAVLKRKTQFLRSFQRIMGYWHAFHFPFAVFMYIAAAIHIASSLIFIRAH